MKQTDQIRALLDEIDQATATPDDQAFARNFNLLELPDLICSVVDFLQPSLLPYEAAVYWHLFRKSIVGTGSQFARASVRGMMTGVVMSSSGQSSTPSYGAIQKALQGLEGKEVISRAGDTTREGTLYKIHLPDEIPLCRDAIRHAQRDELPPIDEKKELDFYNVAENRLKIFKRDDFKCRYCGKQLTRFTATLDHLQPVSEGGDNSFDNLVTACLHCNSQRGSRPVMDVLTDTKPQQLQQPNEKEERLSKDSEERSAD